MQCTKCVFWLSQELVKIRKQTLYLCGKVSKLQRPWLFYLAKPISDRLSFVQAQFTTLVESKSQEQQFWQNGFQFSSISSCSRVISQVTMKADGLDKKSGDMLSCMTLLPELTEIRAEGEEHLKFLGSSAGADIPQISLL